VLVANWKVPLYSFLKNIIDLQDIAQGGFPVEEMEAAGYFPGDNRNLGEAIMPEAGRDAIGRSVRGSSREMQEDRTPGTRTQIRMLFQREMVHLVRDWTVPFMRIFLVSFLGAFIGLIFFKVGTANQRIKINLHSQFGATIVVLVASMMTAVQMSLFTFPEERPVFLREYSTKHYSVLSYFVSHLATEAFITAVQTLLLVTIIYYLVDFQGTWVVFFLSAYGLAMATTAQAIFGSCLAGGDTKLAMQLMPLLFAPQMLFAGFFVAPGLMPKWLRWAQYICTMTYSSRILVIEEFENCSDDPIENSNCMDMLTQTDSEPDEVWWYWLALLGLFVFFRLLALWALRRSALVFY
jgi:ABC-type multidrug transport system permease subunit